MIKYNVLTGCVLLASAALRRLPGNGTAHPGSESFIVQQWVPRVSWAAAGIFRRRLDFLLRFLV